MKLTVFPASDGDCLLLSYGSSPARHILVDGGRASTYAHLQPILRSIVDAGECIELLVLSHIDADHIEGLLQLIQDIEINRKIKEVWFNGYDQLFDLEVLGFAQADAFSNALREKQLPVNVRFGGKAVVLPEAGALPQFDLDGGLRLTLISPDHSRLQKLKAEWAMWRGIAIQASPRQNAVAPQGLELLGRKAMPAVLDVDELAEARERVDTETPNGSSIAFVAEWSGKRILFAADAHPTLLTESLKRLRGCGENQYNIDLFKVSHHGSTGNTTRALMQSVDCGRFVISTDGSRHGHPDPDAVAKLLKHSGPSSKELIFNYASTRTLPWNSPELCAAWGFDCRFAAQDAAIEIEV